VAAASNYVELFAGAERYLVRSSMNEIEEKLPRESFARIHRSVIVNVDRVAELRPAADRGDAMVVMKGGKQLPLSRSYRDRITAMFAEL
jgi:two-component system LytT family response regulator